MLTKELNNVLEQFERDLTIAVKAILFKKGVDKNSNLIKSVEVEYNEHKDMFQILANDYMGYVSEGRRPKARKVPIDDLIKWIKKNNISSTGNINQTAFAIQQAIYKNGIKGKKFLNSIIDLTTDMIAEYTIDELAKMIVDDIVEAINN